MFHTRSGDQFRAKPPPPLNSQQYATDYNEVKTLGTQSNSARTPEQTELAYFYAGKNGNNFVLWHRALRDVAAAHVKGIEDNARLLALANLAMADAVIAAWDSKKHYVLWRPVTAIQEGENDGNVATAGDPSWQPFLNTPPYPEYTSGANVVTGALTRTLALFFGKDDMTFTATSDYPQAAQRLALMPVFLTWQPIWSMSAFTRASISVPRTKPLESRAQRWPSGCSDTLRHRDDPASHGHVRTCNQLSRIVRLTFCRAKRARGRLQDHSPATAPPMPIRKPDQRGPKTSDIPDATTRPMMPRMPTQIIR